MLIIENNEMVGAVSGGCVEKDILRQSQSVFQDGNSKMMTYDGRYRLGCEGILFIILEEFKPNEEFLEEFKTRNCIPHASAARPITPPNTSISLTNCPLPIPPIAGLHDIAPMESRRIVKSRTLHPILEAAKAASPS